MGDQLITVDERRRAQRLQIQMPMFLRGTNAQGEDFLELAKTLDISAGGAYLACSRTLHRNDIVSLTIPAPPPSNSGLVPGGTPPMQARVRRIQQAGEMNLLGVEFLRPIG